MRAVILAAIIAAALTAASGHRETGQPAAAVHFELAAASLSVSFPPESLLGVVYGPPPPDPTPDLSQVPDLALDPRIRLAAAATARVNANGGQLNEREIEAVLALAGWDEGLIPDAKAVAWCESRWSPWATGDGGNSLGLFQLWSGWFDAFGVERELWSDPVTNARVARFVLERRGRWGGGGGWSCSP